MENRRNLHRLAKGENFGEHYGENERRVDDMLVLANGFLSINVSLDKHSEAVCQAIDRLTEKVAALTEKVELIASVIENHK